MPYNPFVEQRKAMKGMLLQMWLDNQNKGPTISETKLLAIFSLRTGVSEKTSRQYLKEIKDAYEAQEEMQAQKTLEQQ